MSPSIVWCGRTPPWVRRGPDLAPFTINHAVVFALIALGAFFVFKAPL